MAGTSKSHVSNVTETVVDDAPVQPVARGGKRIKAFPFAGGTTVIIRDVDFGAGNVEHPTVTWDYRIDDFTVEVGKGITEEAANFLVKTYPDSFKFV